MHVFGSTIVVTKLLKTVRNNKYEFTFLTIRISMLSNSRQGSWLNISVFTIQTDVNAQNT